MKKNFIAYHDNCLDGFMAAFITHYKAIYDGLSNVVMLPINYNNKVPIELFNNGDSLIVVDFSFKNKDINAIVDKGVNVVIVDHHKTFIEEYFGQYFIKNNLLNPDKYYHLWSLCDCDDFSLFSKKINENKNHKDELAIYVAYNDFETKPKHNKLSGAGLCYSLLKDDKNFISFIKTFARQEIIETITIAQDYDLWNHDGKPKTLSSYLASWFYDWYKQNKDLRKQLIENPDKSNDIFITLKNLFINTPLKDKLELGKEIVSNKLNEINELCANVSPVVFNKAAQIEDGTIKVGFIPGDRPAALSISLTGSILLQDYGYDVAIMEAFSGEKEITYSMRSDKDKKNVDLTVIIERLIKANVAISGGGHTNAAGITISRENKEVLFYTLLQSQ